MGADRRAGDESWEEALEVAVRAALAAAEVLRRGPGRVTRKPDGSQVSEADVAAETAMRAVIAAACPGDRIVGEELGGTGPPEDAGGRGWALDPLDNTACYLRGSPEYAVLAGLLSGGRAVAGAAVTPHDGAVWRAAEGAGAYGPDGRRLRCSDTAELGEATITFASLRRWRALGLDGALGRVADAAFHESLHGGFRGFLAVASGTVDLCLDPWGHLWDHAALVPLLRESGAACARLTGPRGPVGLVAGPAPLLHAVRGLGLPLSPAVWNAASYRRVETDPYTVGHDDPRHEGPRSKTRPQQRERP
ncbi:hypothetical protein GCM10027168_72140 [Streptomyces capparidis]